MKGSKSRNRGLNTRILASACLAGGAAIAFPQLSHADVVLNIGLDGSTAITTTTGGLPANGGVVPVTYTPVKVTVPDAPAQTYDAADTSDTGTIWNSVEGMSGNGTSSVSSILFEQNLPLVSSVGGATTAELNVSALEGSGKMDYLHINHNIGRTGTDSLLANPATSTYGASIVGDGYAANASDQLVMGTNWITNSTSDGASFEVTGLSPGDTFDLYVYGCGTATGSGGKFTLAAGNGGASVSTNTNATGQYMSVFDSGGINPAPEKGLSWNEMSGVVDANGDVTINVASSVSTVKMGIDGFQLDLANVPEPTTVGLMCLGSMGLLARRRPKAKA